VHERKHLKPIPKFETEDAEREFWATHDSTDYVDWSRAKARSFSRLKPSTQTISLRLPVSLMAQLKVLANKRDVPYQSLLKVFLAERVARELQTSVGEGAASGESLVYGRGFGGAESSGSEELVKEGPNTSYVERRSDGGYAVRQRDPKQARATDETQSGAIDRARELGPSSAVHMERDRQTSKGKPDKRPKIKR
jgi:predicted DNA binding CopG/RHH family protein